MNGAATVEAWSGELGIEHWLEPVSCTGDADFDDVIDGVFEGDMSTPRSASSNGSSMASMRLSIATSTQ